MESVYQKLQSNLKLGGVKPNTRNEIEKTFNKSMMAEENYEPKYLNFLKNKNDIIKIYNFVSDKKLSTDQIKNKLKKYLKNPDDLNTFFKTVFNHKTNEEKNKKTVKNKETKEATVTGGSSGAFAPQISFKKNTMKLSNKNIPTVREEDKKIKKVETKEASSSASSGQYSTPKIWAKSMNKKDFRGYSKPLYKGGKFVQVKKKCKKFPYCNQGDINALNIFENELVKGAIDSISKKYKINKNYVEKLLFNKMTKTKF